MGSTFTAAAGASDFADVVNHNTTAPARPTPPTTKPAVDTRALVLASSPASTPALEQNPSLVMLALSFLVMIGVVLIADAFGVHIPKGYIYFAMGFSVFVEMINLRVRSKADAVHLRRNLPE